MRLERLTLVVHFVDSTVVRAHQHAAGAKGEELDDQALGRSVGGFSTKVHVKAEGYGRPMHFVLTPGERHDTVGFGALVKGGKVKRQERGRPKHRSQYLVGDKAYSSDKIRQQLRRSGTTPTPQAV